MTKEQPWLKGLNTPQYDAVTAPLGHLLILAGAGSGKTRVLVNRMAWLIEQDQISPHAIMAVTFTNKAAQEMKSRLQDVLHGSLDGLWVGTFHGLCHRMLRTHYQEAKLPQQFHILDSDDQARIIKRVMQSMNLDMEQWPAKQVQGFINARKDEGLRAAHVVVPSYGPMRVFLDVYREYEQVCQTSGVIDFAELILRVQELLRENDALLTYYQQKFKVILVDEFQDTNTIQYAWIRLLSAQSCMVMAVGDDDQSIYGWRGAKVENIQRFQQDFLPSRLIRLEQNYRSTSTILQAANTLIANNPSRLGKELWTAGKTGEKIVLFAAFNELEEAYFVSERIKQEQAAGRYLKDIAVLYRSNAQSRVLEEALLRRNIPYRIHGGMRYFERAEVKDTLAYLRLMLNQNDDAAFERVINVPARGIGDKTLDEIKTQAKSLTCSLWQATLSVIHEKRLPERACKALQQFLNLIADLEQKIDGLSLGEQIQQVILHSGLQSLYGQMKNDLADSKLANLQELVNAASEFRDEERELPLLVAFLAHASLDSIDMQDTIDDGGYVHMMTLHAAKGLEFPVVFLVGMEEGLFPSKQSAEEYKRLEEERRLCYVGMTRAMERLILSYAETRRQYGRSEYHRMSRFVRELPVECVETVRTKPTVSAALPTTYKPKMTSDHGYYVGQSVSHPKFGPGVIIALEGSGEQLRAHVRFRGGETKWLLIAYAKLTST